MLYSTQKTCYYFSCYSFFIHFKMYTLSWLEICHHPKKKKRTVYFSGLNATAAFLNKINWTVFFFALTVSLFRHSFCVASHLLLLCTYSTGSVIKNIAILQWHSHTMAGLFTGNEAYDIMQIFSLKNIMATSSLFEWNTHHTMSLTAGIYEWIFLFCRASKIKKSWLEIKLFSTSFVSNEMCAYANVCMSDVKDMLFFSFMLCAIIYCVSKEYNKKGENKWITSAHTHTSSHSN